MSLSGKPALVEARLASLPQDAQRELKQRITVIRERLGFIEAAVNAFQSADTTGLQTQITALQNSLSALTIRVTIIETELASLGLSARLITTHTVELDVAETIVVRENAFGLVRPVDLTASFNDDAQFAIGVTIASGSAGGTVQVCRAGVVETPGAGWIVDSTIFCGENGELVQVPVGPIYIPVGYAISADAIQVLPQGWTTDVYHNGIFVGTRQRLNFIDGADIVLQVSDDNTHDRVNIGIGTSAGGAVFPGAGSLTFNGLAPHIGLGLQTVMPGAGVLQFDGQVPQIIVPLFARPGAGSMVLDGLAPTLGQTLSALPGAGAMTIAGLVPTIAQTANRIAVPGPGALALSGLAPSIVNTTGSSIVTPGSGSMVMTGLTPTLSGFTFFRNFADLSTANLTVFKGTVSASTGELVGTPTSGGVHERVYFDLLPADITGAWDIVVHLRVGSGTTLNGILFNTQGDVSGDNTLQNGYWLDTLSGLPRLIKFVAGSGSQLAIKSTPSIANPSKLRVTFNGTNTFHCEADGVALFTDVVDSTFTHGRTGVVFFANPGTPGACIDFGITYTP